MKTIKAFLKITLGVFLMTTVAFANNNNPKNIESSSELNNEYVTVVHENSTQPEAEFLSGLITDYDVRDFEEFDSGKEEYQVIYRSNKGSAYVNYDKEGRIISVNKNLKNVLVSSKIFKQVSEKYEGWEVVKNKYKESYRLGQDVQKTYILTLQNGKDKKKIRVNA